MDSNAHRRLSPKPLAVCLGLALGLSIMPPHSNAAPAGGYIVTNCDDDGPGSLRDIAAQVGDGSDIDLTRLACSRITLTSGAIDFAADSVALHGPGADRLAIDGGAASRVIRHAGNGYLSIDRLTIRNGASHGSGGGCIVAYGSVNLYKVAVTDCRADTDITQTITSGGIYVHGSLYLGKSILSNNIVSAPLGSTYGGGAFVVGSLRLSHSTVSGNVAEGVIANTGGLAVLGDARINYSTIANNAAGYNAGLGIFGQYASGQAYIVESTISGNVASHIIGGIGARIPVVISDSTITGNRDASSGAANHAGGLFLADTFALIQSTIIANNFSGPDASDINGNGSATITGNHDLIRASTLTPPPDTLTADPLLGPLAAQGDEPPTHALLPGSPAIDAGDSGCSCRHDQRFNGHTRLAGAAADIGAYEVQSTGIVHHATTCADTGVGSIRNLIAGAVSGDTIDLTSLTCSRITLTSGSLGVDIGNLAIVGPGSSALTIDGNDNDRILRHTSHGTLSLSGLALTHGYYSASAAAGGCISANDKLVLNDVALSSCALVADMRALGGAISTYRLEMRHSRVVDSVVQSLGYIAYGGGVQSGPVTIEDSTIAGNAAISPVGFSAFGGGLVQYDQATILRSTISGNSAANGAGLCLTRFASVIDSTVSGNIASGYAGGIEMQGRLELYNSTIALNTSADSSAVAGVNIDGGFALIGSSILFGNTNNGIAFDLGAESGGFVDGGDDLIGASTLDLPPDTLHSDPLLGPLQDNGGPTMTHALQAGSPAIDAGDNFQSLATDQRGLPRVAGFGTDIGAFEVEDGDEIFHDSFELPPARAER
jgi:hypothetical protein